MRASVLHPGAPWLCVALGRFAWGSLSLCAAACMQEGDPAQPGTFADGGESETGVASCPADLPASCPSATPSFARDVQPVIELRCNPCHGPGGVAQVPFDFSTYEGIARALSPIEAQVYSCRMPPPGSPSPSLSEREALLAWLVCGAPDN